MPRTFLEDRGFLVPMGNAWALSRAIDAQLALIPVDDVARSTARADNRRHVTERFGADKMIKGFHDIWFEETT